MFTIRKINILTVLLAKKSNKNNISMKNKAKCVSFCMTVDSEFSLSPTSCQADILTIYNHGAIQIKAEP